jgi:ribonuclease HII
MLKLERRLREKGFSLVVGVDEAGRGPLAGPVVAAAVALKKVNFQNRIFDSKQLTSLQREKAFSEIINNSVFGISCVSGKVIDRINILKATSLAMRRAVKSLIKKIGPVNPAAVHIIVDGNMDPGFTFACTPVVKGDAKSQSIAAASILAKVTRDRIMLKLDEFYPGYGFKKHKGYPTREHYACIRRLGVSFAHRKSFNCA